MTPFDISHGTSSQRNEDCAKCICAEKEPLGVGEAKRREAQDVEDQGGGPPCGGPGLGW